MGNDARVPSGSVNVLSSTEIVRLAPGAASNLACVAWSTTTGMRPFFKELFRKMSAIEVLITARKP